jgi:hypothetical protein
VEQSKESEPEVTQEKGELESSSKEPESHTKETDLIEHQRSNDNDELTKENLIEMQENHHVQAVNSRIRRLVNG